VEKVGRWSMGGESSEGSALGVSTRRNGPEVDLATILHARRHVVGFKTKKKGVARSTSNGSGSGGFKSSIHSTLSN
jgi:hypothetical protein